MSRMMSETERFFYELERLATQNFVMVVTVSEAIPEVVLRRGLDMLQAKHPPLRWRIRERVGGVGLEFCTDGVPPIPLKIMKRENEMQWAEEVEREQNTPCPLSEGPLGRVVVLEGAERSEILLVFCHIAADGKSVVPFVRDLMTICGELKAGKEPEPLECLEEPMSVLELLKERTEPVVESGKNIETEGADGEEPEVEDARCVKVAPEKYVPHKDRSGRMIPFRLEPEETRRLVARCKSENVSVQGVLSAVILQAITAHYRDAGNENGPLWTGCGAPINLRNEFVKPMEEDFGYYITFAEKFLFIDENQPPWEAAKAIKQSIDDNIASGSHIDELRELPDLIRTFQSVPEMLVAIEQMNPPVVVTNMGKLDIPARYGDIVIEKIGVSGAMHTLLKMAVGVVNFADIMTINFIYSYPCISEENARKIGGDFVRRLKEL
jgi:phenolphthiocerol/phthiocerol/phthiodiolone dimycocerosyl transferase